MKHQFQALVFIAILSFVQKPYILTKGIGEAEGFVRPVRFYNVYEDKKKMQLMEVVSQSNIQIKNQIIDLVHPNHLVDSTLNFYWANNELFGSLIEQAMSPWEDLNQITFNRRDEVGKGVLQFFLNDMGANGILGYFEFNQGYGSIEMNSYYFEQLSTNQKVNALMHEIGHSLGLGEFNSGVYGNPLLYVNESSFSLMHQGYDDYIGLSSLEYLVMTSIWSWEYKN